MARSERMRYDRIESRLLRMERRDAEERAIVLERLRRAAWEAE